MIFSNLGTAEDFSVYPEAVQKAITYLKNNDFSQFEPGEYPIEGKDIYANVLDLTSQSQSEVKPECHKEYTDLQYWVSGEELVGISLDKGRNRIVEVFEDKDLYYCENPEQENFLKARAGDFMVFFPQDIHRPGVAVASPASYRKVVVKISVRCFERSKSFLPGGQER